MEHNENQKANQKKKQKQQPGNIDRKNLAFLAGGILIMAAAVILAVYLFTDKTNASTETGDAVKITPDRIEQISDEVSEQVLKTLSADILADMVGAAVSEELSKDKIYEIISKDGVNAVAVGEEELRGLLSEMLSEPGITGGVLTDDQKQYIKETVERALKDLLNGVSVSQLLTEAEKRQLTEQLKRDLSDMLKNQMHNSTLRLTDQELERIKKSLNLESLMKSAVSQETKQQLEKLQANIIANVKKSVKTPVKGVDYFTASDIKSIQEKVLKAANSELLKQIESLTLKINDVKSSVNTLTTQVKELKKLDKEKSAGLEKLQSSIVQINQSIRHINNVTKQLTDAVTVSGGNLERVTGSGSDIRSENVSAKDLTIAEFVDVLAGNDQIYTGAIQDLAKIVKDLKDENKRQDESFDRSLKELENSLDSNGKALEDTKAALEKSDQDIKSELDQKSEDLQKKLAEEQKERKDADDKLQKQADAADELTGNPKEADGVKGDTIFQKIGSIVKILSSDGIEGLFAALKEIGGAQTVEEGMENLNTDLLDARTRVGKLEKEKWLSDITLTAKSAQEDAAGFTYQESGSSYVYQIPVVSEEDGIDLSEDDTAIVVEFRQPGKLPSNVALSTSGNMLLITFTNRPARDIKITTIHVYKEK